MSGKIGKKILRLICVSIAVFGCFVIGGCGWNLPESAKDKALEYLNTKYSDYGDTFSPVLFIPSDWSNPVATITFKSKKYDDKIVTVFIHSDKETYYSDDYYQMYMAEEVEQYFYNVAKEHEITATPSITFGATGIYEEIDAETTFEEYINAGLGHMISYYFVTDSVEEEKAKALVKDLASRGISGGVDFYLCSNEEELPTIIANEEYTSEKVTRLYSYFIWDEENINTYQ